MGREGREGKGRDTEMPGEKSRRSGGRRRRTPPVLVGNLLRGGSGKWEITKGIRGAVRIE